MSNNPQDRKLRAHLPRLSSTSYVYPVKSLLEGRIQPASSPNSPGHSKSRIATSLSSDDIANFQNKHASPQNFLQVANERAALGARDVYSSSTNSPPEQNANIDNPQLALSPRITFEHGSKKSRKRAFSTSSISSHELGKSQEVNSLEFSTPLSKAQQNDWSEYNRSTHALPTAPSFQDTNVVVRSTGDPGSSEPTRVDPLPGPSSFHLTAPPDKSETLFSGLLHSDFDPPSPFAGTSGQQLTLSSNHAHAQSCSNLSASFASSISLNEGGEEDPFILPFNPAEYGLVHLPPLPLPTNEKAPLSSHVQRKTSMKSFSVHDSLSTTGRISPQNFRDTTSNSQSGMISSDQSNRASLDASPNGESKDSAGVPEPYISVRFRSMQDANGNHVIIGREGTLIRCEDEPIRTPGSIQSFGVLIALDEKADALVVRQVSENSAELLGLPPHYLFSLECFTETLPEGQATLLWDNIEFLSDPSLQSEDEENAPHVFILTGFGAPGTALPDDPNALNGKRSWTCWCAIHRSEVNDRSQIPGLIVMEFELEKDTLHPLYPTASTSSIEASETSSPAHQDIFKSNQSSPRLGSDQSTAVKFSNKESPPSSSSCQSPPESEENSTGCLPSGLVGDEEWSPSKDHIFESTTIRSKPLPALERLRRITRTAVSFGNPHQKDSPRLRKRRDDPGPPERTFSSHSFGVMDIFAVMSQINEQLGAASDLDSFLQVVVGVVKDLTQFHRVMVYQFDELWNGKVQAELVDWSQSHDLYRGLHFPASDIPLQARQLYAANKVRLLYNRAQPTARIVARDKSDIDRPLDMTNCYLRAMSPIHITYLQNMGVRASMSVSIMAFGQLWGLITCHSYGVHGMRVSFPVRQMLRLLSQSISKNIERLSYAQRLHTRKLINSLTSEPHSTGYIVSNTNDLLELFEADFGILVVGEGAKILGPNRYGQEILIMAEYLRLKQFDTIQASQAVIADFPDLELTTGLEIIAGLLYVPLSSGGKDFIAFLRKGQPRQVNWAGKPYKDENGHIAASLEPRKSFKIWSETIAGRSRAWTEEQLDTAGVLAFVYGKFIEVWREKENAMQASKLTNLLLSNASHEVRTPLNHIINYLELAMNGPLDQETRDNLKRSHKASKANFDKMFWLETQIYRLFQSLLFTINDLLDLTRHEIGNETSFNELFDLHVAVREATRLYAIEAQRRNIGFLLDLMESPNMVVGDVNKIRTVVQNLTANALKYTTSGSITVSCRTYSEPEGLRGSDSVAVEILVADTGCGIGHARLESIFREFEQVESSEPKPKSDGGVGLGLAVVARIVEQLGGQLRVDSEIGQGSQFSFLIPLSLYVEGASSKFPPNSRRTSWSSGSLKNSPSNALSGNGFPCQGLGNLDNALFSNHMVRSRSPRKSVGGEERECVATNKSNTMQRQPSFQGVFGSPVTQKSPSPLEIERRLSDTTSPHLSPISNTAPQSRPKREVPTDCKLKVLVVEDNDINRLILAKRLTLNGHTVIHATNGQEGFDKVVSDPAIDLVLMDIQMPILNGFESTQRIRNFEEESRLIHLSERLSQILNGRIPIIVVSASLAEKQRKDLIGYGVDGWILKPIDFTRLKEILKGVTDPKQRLRDVYKPGCNWEAGGWLKERGS